MFKLFAPTIIFISNSFTTSSNNNSNSNKANYSTSNKLLNSNNNNLMLNCNSNYPCNLLTLLNSRPNRFTNKYRLLGDLGNTLQHPH